MWMANAWVSHICGCELHYIVQNEVHLCTVTAVYWRNGEWSWCALIAPQTDWCLLGAILPPRRPTLGAPVPALSGQAVWGALILGLSADRICFAALFSSFVLAYLRACSSIHAVNDIWESLCVIENARSHCLCWITINEYPSTVCKCARCNLLYHNTQSESICYATEAQVYIYAVLYQANLFWTLTNDSPTPQSTPPHR